MTHSNSASDNIYTIWKDTPIPKHTIGDCKNRFKAKSERGAVKKGCGSTNVDLGNGYCVKCWDKGYGGQRGDIDTFKETPEDRKVDTISTTYCKWWDQFENEGE